MQKIIIQITEKKIGLNGVFAEYFFEKETPASLVIQYLQATIKAIEESVENAVTQEFKAKLKNAEFINESTEDLFIKNATHLMPMGKLSIENPRIYWLKES